jgi:hypothetical protein
MRCFVGIITPVLLALGLTAGTAWGQDERAPKGADAKAEGRIGANVRGDEAGVNDRRDARDDSVRDNRDGGNAGGDRANDPRYRFFQGRWWFQTANGGWLYWQDGRWNQFQGGSQRTYSQPAYSQPMYSQPRYGYYNDGRYYNNNYGYRQPYYGRGYYNDGYYRSGYRGYGYDGPGYGNRGWGNMNYGSRGANRGSNIGGMIDQGFGGSGRAGAAIGGAISR